MEKYYVYCRYIGSGSVGREDLSGVYDSWELAIERVTALYNRTAKTQQQKANIIISSKRETFKIKIDKCLEL